MFKFQVVCGSKMAADTRSKYEVRLTQQSPRLASGCSATNISTASFIIIIIYLTIVHCNLMNMAQMPITSPAMTSGPPPHQVSQQVLRTRYMLLI